MRSPQAGKIELDVHATVECTCDIAFSGQKFGRISWTIKRPRADRSSAAASNFIITGLGTIGPVHDDPVLFSQRYGNNGHFFIVPVPGEIQKYALSPD